VTAGQLALDCEPDWNEPADDTDDQHHDHRGQLRTVTDIPLTGSYL